MKSDSLCFMVALRLLAGMSSRGRFEWRKEQLDAIHLPDRSWTLLDSNNCSSHVAFGAVAENIDLAARELGLRRPVRAGRRTGLYCRHPDLSVVPDLPYSISIHDIGLGGVLASPAFRRRQEDLARMATELMTLVRED